MTNNLVLSIFPGIGLLDKAFEEEGYCIVRGPDLLWGGDNRMFHPPAGVFEGVIGGPPCQMFSRLALLVKAQGNTTRFSNLIPEFERVVSEAAPEWFLMENVKEAPTPAVAGYMVNTLMLNNRWIGAKQHRLRQFCFGTGDGRALPIEVVIFEHPLREETVTSDERRVRIAKRPATVLAGHGPVGRERNYQEHLPLAEACELQGLPRDFLDDSPFTAHGKRHAVGNGVPLPMGRAIAKAVRKATVDNHPG